MAWTSEQVAEAEELLASGEIKDADVARRLKLRLQQERTHETGWRPPIDPTPDEIEAAGTFSPEDALSLAEKDAIRSEILGSPDLARKTSQANKIRKALRAMGTRFPGMPAIKPAAEMTPYGVLDADSLRVLSSLSDEAADTEIKQRGQAATAVGLGAGALAGLATGGVLPAMSPVLAAIIEGTVGGLAGGAAGSAVRGESGGQIAKDAAIEGGLGALTGGVLGGAGALLRKGGGAYQSRLRDLSAGAADPDARAFVLATSPETIIPGATPGRGATTSVLHSLEPPPSAAGMPGGDHLPGAVARSKARKIAKRVFDEKAIAMKEAESFSSALKSSDKPIADAAEITSILDEVAGPNLSSRTAEPFSDELVTRLAKIRRLIEPGGDYRLAPSTTSTATVVLPGQPGEKITEGFLERLTDHIDNAINWANVNERDAVRSLQRIRAKIDDIRNRNLKTKAATDIFGARITKEKDLADALGMRSDYATVDQALDSNTFIESMADRLVRYGSKDFEALSEPVVEFLKRNPDMVDDFVDIAANNAFAALKTKSGGGGTMYVSPGTSQPVRGAVSRGGRALKYRADPVAGFLAGINPERAGPVAGAIGGGRPPEAPPPFTVDELREIYRELLKPSAQDVEVEAR